jgi:hypothetical protein
MYNFSITILAFGLTLSNSAILAQTTSSDNTQDKPWVPQKLTPVPPTEEIFTMGGISAEDNPPVPVMHRDSNNISIFCRLNSWF